MRGIVLCGGLGTRMGLFTQRVSNKHLIPVYDVPMILLPIKTLVDAGIKDICVVTGGRYKGHIMDLLGDGQEFGCNINYAFQYGEGGIADALSKAKPFVGGDDIAVILGDNVFEKFDLKGAIKEFKSKDTTIGTMWGTLSKHNAMVFLKAVHDPERYGVAEIKTHIIPKKTETVLDTAKLKMVKVTTKKQTIKEIVSLKEKPKRPRSNLAVTGLYLYDSSVWDKIKQCKPSGRGELEITDVNKMYLDEKGLHYHIVKGFWSDAGTPDSLITCSQWLKENKK